MRLAVAAGHGLPDPGAVAGSYQESDWALEASRILAGLGREQGLEVLEVRSGSQLIARPKSKSLRKRCWLANHFGADVYLELHLDAGGGTGSSVIHAHGSSLGLRLARIVREELRALGRQLHRDGILDERDTRVRKLAVLRGTRMPALIVELGFIDNPVDLKAVHERQGELLAAVLTGVMRFLGLSWHAAEGEPRRRYRLSAVVGDDGFQKAEAAVRRAGYVLHIRGAAKFFVAVGSDGAQVSRELAETPYRMHRVGDRMQAICDDRSFEIVRQAVERAGRALRLDGSAKIFVVCDQFSRARIEQHIAPTGLKLTVEEL